MDRTFFKRPFLSPLIMGILNVTPDSFSDGGDYANVEEAVTRGLQMVDEGADIIDIGGESTRPPGKDYGAGSASLDVETELARVVPVIQGLVSERPDLIISIDSMKPEVAEEALKSGARIVNDVSGGLYHHDIWKVAADYRAPYILMHGHNPHQRQEVDSVSYSQLLPTVHEFLITQAERAKHSGVETIIIDPGIGFAKNASDSLHLIQHLDNFTQSEYPVLIGASRKSFIGRMLGGLPVNERTYGSLGVAAAAALKGTAILRVHDVRATVEMLTMLRSCWVVEID